VLLPAHVAVVVVEETDELGWVEVPVEPPAPKPTSRTTAAITTTKTTPTEIQTTLLLLGEVDIESRAA
jgi:hypothetical protein